MKTICMSSYGKSINAITSTNTDSDKPECTKGKCYCETEWILHEGKNIKIKSSLAGLSCQQRS